MVRFLQGSAKIAVLCNSHLTIKGCLLRRRPFLRPLDDMVINLSKKLHNGVEKSDPLKNLAIAAFFGAFHHWTELSVVLKRTCL